MNLLGLLPVILSMLVLGAHFYRAGLLLLAGGALLALGLLCIRRPLAARLMQGLLAAGAVEWLITAGQLVMFRQSQGLVWLRLALILGLVALAPCSPPWFSEQTRSRTILTWTKIKKRLKFYSYMEAEPISNFQGERHAHL